VTPSASPVDWEMEMVMPLGVLESIHSLLAKVQAEIDPPMLSSGFNGSR
jgi:hypothetical protein